MISVEVTEISLQSLIYYFSTQNQAVNQSSSVIIAVVITLGGVGYHSWWPLFKSSFSFPLVLFFSSNHVRAFFFFGEAINSVVKSACL